MSVLPAPIDQRPPDPQGPLIAAFEEEQKTNVFSALSEYLHQNLFCDVSLVVGHQILRAHKVVLASSSKFFSNAFGHYPSLSTIDLDRELAPHGIDVSFEDVRLIIGILYCVGTVEISPPRIESLLLLAQVMGVPSLIRFLRRIKDTLISDETLDPAYRSLLLMLPTQEAIAQSLFDKDHVPDPDQIYISRHELEMAFAKELNSKLPDLYNKLAIEGPFNPNSKAAGKRALRSTALKLITKLDHGKTAHQQFITSNNMTEQLSALSLIISAGVGEKPSNQFYEQWKSDPLVIDKWFTIQVISALPSEALNVTQALTLHHDFNWKNPNRFRSLVGAFASSPAAFHASDGSGYTFVTDWLIKLDAINPQTAARMCGVFETWSRYNKKRQTLITTQLRRIQTTPNLSRDTLEIVSKILG